MVINCHRYECIDVMVKRRNEEVTYGLSKREGLNRKLISILLICTMVLSNITFMT